MRMSSFVPCNVPITWGMICAAPTPFNTIFWQLINQVYTALVNYGNRNATTPYTTRDIINGFMISVGSSVAVALAIRKAFEGYTRHLHGARLIAVNTVSTFWACAFSGYLNAYYMRRSELEHGIDIEDEEGNVYGKSKIAAKYAVKQTAESRFILALPTFIPPAVLYWMERRNKMPRSYYACFGLQIALIYFELYLEPPFSIAIYP